MYTYGTYISVDINEWLGRKFKEVKQVNDTLEFITDEGDKLVMLHFQDCCESVWLEDINGDLQDLVGAPIMLAEEVVSDSTYDQDSYESSTWTFYKFQTSKGHVTLRWCGSSNGYYSESVDLIKVPFV